jgi:hypothetical protein
MLNQRASATEFHPSRLETSTDVDEKKAVPSAWIWHAALKKRCVEREERTGELWRESMASAGLARPLVKTCGRFNKGQKR